MRTLLHLPALFACLTLISSCGGKHEGQAIAAPANAAPVVQGVRANPSANDRARAAIALKIMDAKAAVLKLDQDLMSEEIWKAEPDIKEYCWTFLVQAGPLDHLRDLLHIETFPLSDENRTMVRLMIHTAATSEVGMLNTNLESLKKIQPHLQTRFGIDRMDKLREVIEKLLVDITTLQ